MTVNAEALWTIAVNRRRQKWVRQTLRKARSRAKKRGLPCSLEVHDIATPEVCPITLVVLDYFHTSRENDSPALMLYEPQLGYVSGNILTTSYWAVSLKGERNWTEFEAQAERLLADAIKRVLGAGIGK